MTVEGQGKNPTSFSNITVEHTEHNKAGRDYYSLLDSSK